jgi:hypothetical protein
VAGLRREAPALQGPEKGELADLFASILEGLPLEGIRQELHSRKLRENKVSQAYAARVRTPEDSAAMERAVRRLETELAGWTRALIPPKRKTVLAANIASFPQDPEGAGEALRSAFQAAPKDLMGPLLDIHIYYTDAQADLARGMEEYLNRLRKEEPALAARVHLKQKTSAGLKAALTGHGERVRRDENLIFLVPDLVMAEGVRSGNVMVHEDSSIPPAMRFTRRLLPQAAVGLAEALRLPETDPVRTAYLDHLRGSLGLTMSKDEDRDRSIIGFDLSALVEKLVELQAAQLAVARAA